MSKMYRLGFLVFCAVVSASLLLSNRANAQVEAPEGPFGDMHTICYIITLSQNPNLMKDVTVNGENVVPADVNDFSSLVPEVVEFPVSIDLAEAADHPKRQPEMLSEVGTLKVNTKTGATFFNDEEITKDVSDMCAGHLMPQ